VRTSIPCIPRDRWSSSAVVALVLALGGGSPAAQEAVEAGFESLDLEDLTELSLEELMDLDVTIASRSEEGAKDIPAAVYVLTGDEIRRSGHSSIPEALRMVPGFYVSHWTTNSWDVTARGFGPGVSPISLAFLNQLLVLVDGVSVYTPAFPGVWWHLQDIDLADVERIEIIRGPGGILWGSNATHGVVNIITKDSADTLGPRTTLRYGAYDQHASVRYGTEIGENGTFRVWGKGANYETNANRFGGFSQDWYSMSGGFRADWKTEEHEVTLSSRFYQAALDVIGFDLMTFIPFSATDRKKGYQLYGAIGNPDQQWRLQASFSADQQARPTLLDSSIDVLDVDLQKKIDLAEGNQLTVGLGYRHIDSYMFGDDPFFLDFDPRNVTQNVLRGYVLDKLALPAIDSFVTLGVTLEDNYFTQLEVQPTARFTWNASDRTAVWTAISRAVRTPSLEERTLSDGSLLIGSNDFESEELIAYELGLRTLVNENVSGDITLFYNDFDNLRFEDFDPGTGQSTVTNEAEGKSYGVEVTVDVKPMERWTLRSAYSFLVGEYETKAGGFDLGTNDYYPEQQFNLRSYYDLGSDWELDAGFYAVQELGSAYEIAEYMRMDVRVGWNPTEDFRFFAGVQDWTQPSHSELDAFDNPRRAGYVGIEVGN